MVGRLIKSAVKKPGLRNVLPDFMKPKLIVDELEEHAGFVKWSAKRLVLPLAVFYIAAGLLFGEHVLGALLMGLVVFLYANFLPDLDSFFPYAAGKRAVKNAAAKKRIALFFAPVVIYYFLSRKLKPWDLGEYKPFHTQRALVEFSAFLFLSGLLLYFSALKAFFFMLFGFSGYFVHLLADRKIKFVRIKI